MFNLASKQFEEKLTNLINNCGLTISEAYYIVENASLRLKLILNDLAWEEKINPQNLVQQKTADVEINNISDLEEDILVESEASE